MTLEEFSLLVKAFGLGAIVSGGLVALVKSKLEQSSENRRRRRELREKQYEGFLKNLMGFREGWQDREKKKKFVLAVNTNAIISASDEVYKLAVKYLETFDPDKKPVKEPERQKIYTDLVISMRNELNKMSGEPKTKLKGNDIKVIKFNN